MSSRSHLAAICAGAITVLACVTFARAQDTQFLPGKNFLAPEYYPASNGVRRLKSVVAGSEYRFITNGIVWLQDPRLTNFSPEGIIEWTVTAPECTVNINTREVNGRTNMVFRTADERLFISGVGFFWQHTNSMLILSNQSFTWIDKRALTNKALSEK
jgi:hypothetical protein